MLRLTNMRKNRGTKDGIILAGKQVSVLGVMPVDKLVLCVIARNASLTVLIPNG